MAQNVEYLFVCLSGVSPPKTNKKTKKMNQFALFIYKYCKLKNRLTVTALVTLGNIFPII